MYCLWPGAASRSRRCITSKSSGKKGFLLNYERPGVPFFAIATAPGGGALCAFLRPAAVNVFSSYRSYSSSPPVNQFAFRIV